MHESLFFFRSYLWPSYQLCCQPLKIRNSLGVCINQECSLECYIHMYSWLWFRASYRLLLEVRKQDQVGWLPTSDCCLVKAFFLRLCKEVILSAPVSVDAFPNTRPEWRICSALGIWLEILSNEDCRLPCQRNSCRTIVEVGYWTAG